MKPHRTLILFLAVALVLSLAANAKVAFGNVHIQDSRAYLNRDLSDSQALGSTFTYQGRLTDGGQPANGFYDFEFRLFSAASGGSQVGSMVVVENRQVYEGLCTAELDFGPAAFNGEARWLEISLRPGASTGAFTTLSPRQALTPAPYALFAGSAPWSGLTGVPAGFADGVDNEVDTAYTDTLYWSLTGNSQVPASNYLGPTGAVTMTLGVNGESVLQLAPNNGTPAARFTVNAGGRSFGTGTGSVVGIGDRYRDNAIVAWARVNFNGSIYADFGINYISHPGVGRYRIHTSSYLEDGASLIPVVVAEIEAVPTDPASMRLVYINQIGDGPSELFEVYITDGAGVGVDNDFVFMVTGR